MYVLVIIVLCYSMLCCDISCHVIQFYPNDVPVSMFISVSISVSVSNSELLGSGAVRLHLCSTVRVEHAGEKLNVLLHRTLSALAGDPIDLRRHAA